MGIESFGVNVPPNLLIVDIRDGYNHLEEKLLDQAQAQVSYTLFWGFIRVAYPKA